MSEKIIALNRKANFNYAIHETFEAGLVLVGTEVKSLRAGKANIGEAFGVIKDGELFLLNAHISEYSHGNINNHEPKRSRKLLVHKKEIMRLAGKLSGGGYALIPLRLYFKDGKAKILLGLGKGKTGVDKREDVKKREARREIDRALKQKNR